jgi:uncharacterized LabA/DUF88 family protein
VNGVKSPQFPPAWHARFDEVFPRLRHETERTYLFVDGENLTCRAQKELGSNLISSNSNQWIRDTFIWSQTLSEISSTYFVRRRFYFTSRVGDSDKIEKALKTIKRAGFEAPRVFKRDKAKDSKRVDISLATEALRNLFVRNYQNMILVTGDEDFLPLVEAAQDMGARVVLWSIKSGLSTRLVDAADAHCDISDFLFDGSLDRRKVPSGEGDINLRPK